jgi:hypothetical protein
MLEEKTLLNSSHDILMPSLQKRLAAGFSIIPRAKHRLSRSNAHNFDVHGSQPEGRDRVHTGTMTAESLRQIVAEFLSVARSAVVMEDGAVVFDLGDARYSISGEHNKCLLHLWSSERNIVRRVVDAEVKNGTLRLLVQRMGQNHPTKLEIRRDRDRRSPSSRRVERAAYENRLRRIMERHFPDWRIVRFTSSMDLEHSFGPAYARGMMWRGQTGLAVLGVNEHETQSTIDAALTIGILWLDKCRQRWNGHGLVQGLALVLPQGMSALTRERMAHLGAGRKWHLYEFRERDTTLESIDCSDRGNLQTRLVRANDEAATLDRFQGSVAQVCGIFSAAEVAVLSPVEISFRLKGLEFARARLAHNPRTFSSYEEIIFGVGAEERVLDNSNEEDFTNLVQLAAAIRCHEGPRNHLLWRMHPERWLESVVMKNVAALDARLCNDSVYEQVPAFSAADRAMIDVLAMTRENRLAVLELKADEDLHLPLQGVDYWSRVSWHQSRGELKKYGYFPRHELSTEPPLLVLVAPALHIHPATDTILRYLSPDIEWQLLGIDEHWREGIKVVFRKRAQDLTKLSVACRTA